MYKECPNNGNYELTSQHGDKFKQLHGFYDFNIGLIDSGIDSIHITMVTDIEYSPENKFGSENFVKSLNNKIRKYAKLSSRGRSICRFPIHEYTSSFSESINFQDRKDVNRKTRKSPLLWMVVILGIYGIFKNIRRVEPIFHSVFKYFRN